MTNNLAHLLRKATEMSEPSRTLERFSERFAVNPADALASADAIYRQAAQQHVGAQVIAWVANTKTNRPDLTDDEVHSMIVGEIEKHVVRRASSPERSTSACSNMMGEEITAAFARFVG